MNLSLITLWVLVGWCGTVPRPPFPPDPPTTRTWLVSRVIGMVAGLVGGYVFTQVFLPSDPVPWRAAVFAAASAVGAFVGARVVTDIYEQLSSRGRR